ncbi:PTS system N-acetylmuramic acid transporter subunits EIIBC [Pasteurella multocida subsp. multocida str. Anand1_cattle]|nr:PTS system N-acetylmuramic acid transporter subunits EIIBC [Pasteurella multocida subsp. multocida str. Anand1_cattle]
MQQAFVAGVENPNAFLVDLIAYMKVFSKGLFSFLSILIGYNAAKAFGGFGCQRRNPCLFIYLGL